MHETAPQPSHPPFPEQQSAQPVQMPEFFYPDEPAQEGQQFTHSEAHGSNPFRNGAAAEYLTNMPIGKPAYSEISQNNSEKHSFKTKFTSFMGKIGFKNTVQPLEESSYYTPHVQSYIETNNDTFENAVYPDGSLYVPPKWQQTAKTYEPSNMHKTIKNQWDFSDTYDKAPSLRSSYDNIPPYKDFGAFDQHLGFSKEQTYKPTPEAAPKPGTFVAEAPSFKDQINGPDRPAPITYVSKTQMALGTETNGGKHKTLSESDSLGELYSFLVKAGRSKNNNLAETAQSIRENLTFIGKPEYDEATRGIADQWRKDLLENPDAQLCVITDQITKVTSGGDAVKSDAYLLDNILKNFSDEDFALFSDRLVTAPGDLTADVENVRVIMLDDWTISGSQMSMAARKVADDYPKYADRLEVQLIAATEDRINKGFQIMPVLGSFNDKPRYIALQVNAYFKANAAPKHVANFSGAHITGAHCAVDYDFNNVMAVLAQDIDTSMPPATNIVRPYRDGKTVLTQKARLASMRSARRTTTLQESVSHAV